MAAQPSGAHDPAPGDRAPRGSRAPVPRTSRDRVSSSPPNGSLTGRARVSVDVTGQQVRATGAPQRLGALEMVRSHREDEVAGRDDFAARAGARDARTRSMPCSIATSNEPSDAGASGHALVPALDTSTSGRARSRTRRRAMPSASGLRQVFPVQTKRMRMGSGVADEVGNAVAQHGGGQHARTDHARSSSRAIDDRRWS